MIESLLGSLLLFFAHYIDCLLRANFSSGTEYSQLLVYGSFCNGCDCRDSLRYFSGSSKWTTFPADGDPYFNVENSDLQVGRWPDGTGPDYPLVVYFAANP